MTSCFVARISNPGERFGKPFYEVDVPSPLRQRSMQQQIPASIARTSLPCSRLWTGDKGARQLPCNQSAFDPCSNFVADAAERDESVSFRTGGVIWVIERPVPTFNGSGKQRAFFLCVAADADD